MPFNHCVYLLTKLYEHINGFLQWILDIENVLLNRRTSTVMVNKI